MEAKGGSPNADRLKGNSEFELQEAQGLSDAAPVIAQSNPVSASQKQLQRHNSHYEVVIGMPENDEVELMDPISPEDQVPVEFSGVNAWVPVGLGAPSIFAQATALFKKKKDSKPQFRQIMHHLSGYCLPGELLAMMGPSGSSKTSLMSVIGGRTPKLVKAEATSILYKGKALNKAIKRTIGYVLQDDLLHESLTVFEVLYYAAMLRLPRKMTKQQKVNRVNTVMKALGLMKCKDTIVGGFFRRGISGGERKRVSVGHELLINPAVLMLDEPTSGLDSTTAMHLVETLRKLASGGRAIITTIHQPSSRLYTMLDKLLLLSEGHAMFYGKATAAAEWFHHLGYTMPYGISMSDFILDLASGDVYTKKLDGEASRKHLIACADRYLVAHPQGYTTETGVTETDLGRDLWTSAQSRRTLDDHRAAMSSRRSLEAVRDSQLSGKNAAGTSSGTGSASDLESGLKAQTGDSQPLKKGLLSRFRGHTKDTSTQGDSRGYGASYLMQVRYLFQRSLKTRRFETLNTQDVIQYVVVGVLAGLFWLQKGQSNVTSEARNVTGLVFFEMFFLALRAMLGALFTFATEFKMLLKERASGMYKLSAFYFARTGTDLPKQVTVPTIFIILIYFLGGLRYNAGAFFANWAAVMLVQLTAEGLGLLIGATITFPKTAQTIASVTALGMTLVAGFFVQGIHSWISWLKYLSFVFYGYNTVIKIEFAGRTLYNCGLANPSNPQDRPDICTPVSGSTLQTALGFSRNPNEWNWEVLALIAMLFFFRVLVYIALRIRTKAKVR